MATAAVEMPSNGFASGLMQPHAQKTHAARVLRKEHDGAKPLPKAQLQLLEDDRSRSGASTPIPEGAPPSVQATSSARKQLRKQEKKGAFPTIDFEARVSHFDPNSDHKDFRGFFVLFWIGLAIMVITPMLRNVREGGFPIQVKQKDVFLENIWELAIADAAMVISTMLCLPLHRLYRSNSLFRWNRAGFWIQSVFEATWLLYWVEWPFFWNWTWTAQVYFVLHMLTVFMKMHSWAFYNAHLGETKRRLDELDNPETASTDSAVKYPNSMGTFNELLRDSSDSENEAPQKEVVAKLREDLAVELTSKQGHVTYPQNLTLKNYLYFLCCPTLCYELEYPTTSGIRYSEAIVKALAVFGCVFLLTITSEEFIIPVLDESAIRMYKRQGLTDGALILTETISKLLFPFMVCFLLVFLVIFEYVCGTFAELTCFADRHFYSDWWNSTDWLEFSREWNIPVHHFFRRHVYLAARSSFSRQMATVITFFISALAHELIMGCITKKLRGYGFVAMMLQIPIVVVQRSKFLKERKLLNNVMFWCSMILGLAMMCALYVLV